MARRLRTLAIAWTGGLALAATMQIVGAQAADPPGTWTAPPEIETAMEQPREYRSGWYLRGDIGYRFNRIGSVSSAAPITSQNYDDMPALSAGAGIKDRWLRVDFTFDYGPQTDYEGTTAGAATQPQYSAKIDTFTGLANAYFDLGSWYGLTPYVGAGGGLSYLRTDNYKNTTLPANEIVAKRAKWDFSWAAMAGVSYRVNQKWTVDVGYRYLRLGDALTSSDSTGNITTWKNLSTQEIRVGFRYQLD